MITKFKIFENNTTRFPVEVSRFLYHGSSPLNRKNILKNGFVLKTDRYNRPKHDEYEDAIFATNSDNEKDWYFSTKENKDIYRIDTSKINNVWYRDQNMLRANHFHVLTFEPIPPEVIELIHKSKTLREGVTPKTSMEDEIDRLMDKGYDNLTPEEKEFLNHPHDIEIETPKSKQEKQILKYYDIGKDFFDRIVGTDIRNYELDDNINLFDIMDNEDEVYHVANTLYYMYGVQIDPEDNDDYKLVNIFKKINQKKK